MENVRENLVTDLLESLTIFRRRLRQSVPEKPKDLPAATQDVFIVIVRHPGIGLKQVAAMLSLTSGAASQQVESLVMMGLVSRQASTVDRRAVALNLTTRGKRLAGKIESVRCQALSVELERLSETELEILTHILKKVTTKPKE